MTPLEQALTQMIAQSPTVAVLLWVYSQERRRADRAESQKDDANKEHKEDLRALAKLETSKE